MWSRFAVAQCAAGTIVFLVLAGAAGAQPGGPLTLAEAVERTLARNPSLKRFGYRLRAQRARVDAAAFNPPLEIQVNVEDILGSGAATGVDGAEAEFAISRVIELGDKRALRVAAADSSTGLIGIEQAAAELDAVAEVTRRFIHVASDEAQLALTERATALARETVEATETRVAAARAPEVELRRARVTLARAEIDQEHAEHELLSSRRRLVALWGDIEPAFSTIDADLYAVPEPMPFASLVARLDGNPDALRFISEARLRDAELRLAAAHARADIGVTAGIRRLQRTRDQAFVVGVTIPLGTADRARSAREEAAALRALSDVDAQVHRVHVEAELFSLYQELLHAITESESLRSSIVPEMEAALAATREAFERGRYSLLEWVDAQRELIVVQRELIDASASAHLYLAEIERLTGEPLSPTTP